ncbi:uncharacterized protein (DUF2147 family) [Dyadobacter sp. BE34]|uniref:Uncharacterized protein (DUF2147 family) n=1 Tax=Dyadobacter fermentans TaxID=94254 RepID=A0ABU1R894_9BACT|nr:MULTISPECIES: DUF2147 domain-containing protein [Dyadobacter]MDR6809631.1 uncharacterized protein (DUF2147 family) [Dyadobacter fermentans]MDR7047309.1 uncharacterized protein (DUF2147 family) [Dyadobacter sp. BE242]MDR7201545.1 uncharacterized protein (DUF2147 family) [Dyadobacter sp. BE34]MDR7219415.1 uncharacterized protein (DUF2147 family) [Dyadobacter sp. BE31]MDR7267191.1 uncharacterized protein (DUF2147 family) [Dyadobacter sp. BE32]
MDPFRKSAYFAAGILVLLSTAGYGQKEITGKWLSPDGDRKIEIFENNGSFFGKIIWLKNTAGKIRVGDIVLKDITYKNDQWEGKAYIPARDQDIPVSISMSGNDELQITGKAGMMSRKKLWKRCK